MTDSQTTSVHPPSRHSRAGFAIAALAALYLLVYIAPLNHRPLFSPDEVRYAEIPREMLTSGDWVVPRLNGLRYFEKPPLGYWVHALAMEWFGENPFSVRLPSAVAAGLTALIVFFMTVAACASRRIGLLAAAMYLTFTEVYLLGTFSTLDSLLSLWLAAGIFAFYRAVVARDHSKGRWWAALSGAAIGLGFLTKGFLGVAIPGLVMLPWLIVSRRLRVGIARTWPCALAALLVSLPWGIAIHLQESDYWHYFFWEEHVRRFMGENAQHKEDGFFFIRLLPIVALPWIFFAPASVSGLRHIADHSVSKDSLRLLTLWCLLPFTFFSISSGKLITYILPCFAPLAALTAIGLSSYLQTGRRKLFDYCQWLLAGLFAAAMAAILIAQNTDLLAPFYATAEPASTLLAGASFAVAAILGVLAARSRLASAKLALCALSMASVMAVAQFVMPTRLVERKAPGLLLSPLRDEISEDAIIVTNSGLLREASWYFRRDDVYIISYAGEGTYGLRYADAAGRLLDPAMFRSLVEANFRVRDIVIVCKRGCGAEYESALPASARRLESGVYHAWYLPKD